MFTILVIINAVSDKFKKHLNSEDFVILKYRKVKLFSNYIITKYNRYQIFVALIIGHGRTTKPQN